MIDPIERYKFITSQLQYFNEKIVEAFRLYIQLVTAVMGGYIWLKSQTQTVVPSNWVRVVFPALMVFIGLGSVLLIVVNLSSWWGFRKAESALLKGIVPPPVFPRSARQEIVMIMVIIAISSVGAWYLAR